jgi:hypothetical protein
MISNNMKSTVLIISELNELQEAFKVYNSFYNWLEYIKEKDTKLMTEIRSRILKINSKIESLLK